MDKFAILASQKEGETHKFFNSFSDALPPDLIIQDELHLISGPLGSIVGIFESVVDLRQNQQVDLVNNLAQQGTYTWYVYPLDANYVQIP